MGKMDNLPKGWTKEKLPQVAEVIMGQSPPSSSYNTNRDGVPFFQGKAEFGTLYPSVIKYCNSPKKIAEAGDVLISVRAPVGPTNLCKEKSCIGRGLAALRPNQVTTTKYLLYYMRDIESWLSTQGTGSTFTAISKTDIENVEILLPPLNEQRRIVAKLEKLLQKVDACKDRLDKIPTILKRFRQSILAVACSGRLTADWRGENSNSEEYPPSWKLDELSKYIQSMKNGIYKPEKYYSHNGVICLRMYNIQDGKIVWKNLKRMLLTSDEAAKYSLKPGDILVNRVNSRELVGKAAIIGAVDEPVIFESKNIRLRLNAKQMAPNYVNYCFMTRIVRDVFEDKAKQTVGMATISQPQIANLRLPIPKIDEQNEIIRRVEALFKIADQIEERYQKARSYVDKLTQSILAKAFRGELVPQDPNDEPASELLKRIKNERDNDKRKSWGSDSTQRNFKKRDSLYVRDK